MLYVVTYIPVHTYNMHTYEVSIHSLLATSY